MVGRSWIPGVPRDDGNKAKEGQRAPTIQARRKLEHLIHHTCIHSRAASRGLYLSEHALSERIEFGSRGTCVEEEVVVHGVVVGSSGSRDGS